MLRPLTPGTIIQALGLLATLSSLILLAASNAAARDIDRAAPTSARGQAMIIEADEGGYADVVVAGDTVYLSGYVAGLREGETDLDAAYDRAFRGMGAILAKAGVTWDDVVEIISYHTDIGTQIDSYSKVRRRFVKPPFPTSTVIQVVRLIPDRGLTEVRLTARITKKN